MALAANFHAHLLPRGTGSEGIAAGTNHSSIGEILGVDLFFHLL
jgi:hypothetical protein